MGGGGEENCLKCSRGERAMLKTSLVSMEKLKYLFFAQDISFFFKPFKGKKRRKRRMGGEGKKGKERKECFSDSSEK